MPIPHQQSTYGQHQYTSCQLICCQRSNCQQQCSSCQPNLRLSNQDLSNCLKNSSSFWHNSSISLENSCSCWPNSGSCMQNSNSCLLEARAQDSCQSKDLGSIPSYFHTHSGKTEKQNTFFQPTFFHVASK